MSSPRHHLLSLEDFQTAVEGYFAVAELPDLVARYAAFSTAVELLGSTCGCAVASEILASTESASSAYSAYLERQIATYFENVELSTARS